MISLPDDGRTCQLSQDFISGLLYEAFIPGIYDTRIFSRSVYSNFSVSTVCYKLQQ